MNRKSLIACLAVLAAMVLAVAVAVAFLYHDADKARPVKSHYQLLQAIPSNAVTVVSLDEMDDVCMPAFAGFDFPAALAEKISEGHFETLVKSPMALSLHYSGKLAPLYVIDAGPASSDPSADAAALMEFGRRSGLSVSYVDCSAVMDSYNGLATRSLVVMAETESLVKSSQRHLEQSLSVMEAAGFNKAAKVAQGNDVLFLPYSQIKPVFGSLFVRRHSHLAAFAGTFGEWAVFSIGSGHAAAASLKGTQIYEDDPSEFMTVIENSAAAVPSVSSVLPSYTSFALTLPMTGEDSYVTAYQSYLDSKQMLSNYNHRLTQLKKKNKVAPQDFFRRIGVREVASAVFGNSDKMHRVNLVKCDAKDTIIFRGTGVKTFKGYEPQVHAYAFPTYVSAVFGDYFRLEDESCFTYVDGWLVTGSEEAVKEYQSGRAVAYTLDRYMADAGEEDLLAQRKCSMAAYVNAGYEDFLKSVLKSTDMVTALTEGVEYCPMVMHAYVKDGRVATDLELYNLSMQRIQAPEFERDTVVTIPAGPFEVKNSATGRTNLFYQNSHGAICLKEEDGTGIWGVPFGKPLCGAADNVDYYANGKLQIIFGAGSDIYIIDRLGRFVPGFPVSLGKEILLGPDVYDFNGSRAYNIMVLHKDNTIEMYNLKGQQPAGWKTIGAAETIKGLPERIDVGGNTFWVVRTSIRTLIFPFLGGESLTTFEGQKMILPSSAVRVVDEKSVEVECYDGHLRTVTLK